MAKFQSSAVDLGPTDKILSETGESDPGILIPVLQKLQDTYGYLPVPVLKYLSVKTGIPISRIHGVITFYSQFTTAPRGRHSIRSCEGTACHVKGSRRICEYISDELGIKPGETTTDMRFSYEIVACLGTCFLAPVLMIDDDYYGQISPDKIKSILKKYK